MTPENKEFFLYGFVAAGIIGFILVQIRAARLRMGQPFRPLDTFPDAFQHNMTSMGVVRGGLCGLISFVVWAIVLTIFGTWLIAWINGITLKEIWLRIITFIQNLLNSVS